MSQLSTRENLPQPLRVALMGTRGIPAAYGGFETFAEELSRRLVARGHSVCVYQRHSVFERLGSYTPEEIRGVTRRSTATLMHKYAETPLSALTSFIDLYRRRSEFDVVLLCNAANSPFAFLARLAGVPLAINVDGIERNRKKWNGAGKLWYRLGEWTSVKFGDQIVSDAEIIAQYYREVFEIESEVIGYGCDPRPLSPGPVLAQFGLQPQRYILYVSRFEPENNALGVIQGYLASGITDYPLVLVGDAPYAADYKEKLRAAAASAPGRIVFTGFQFGEAYRELRSNCMIYVQATEVGGTHPALVEAMAYGNPVVANDVPEHREVLKGHGQYYPYNNFQTLGEILKALCSSEAEASRRAMGGDAARYAEENYSWDAITDRYEQLLSKVKRSP